MNVALLTTYDTVMYCVWLISLECRESPELDWWACQVHWQHSVWTNALGGSVNFHDGKKSSDVDHWSWLLMTKSLWILSSPPNKSNIPKRASLWRRTELRLRMVFEWKSAVYSGLINFPPTAWLLSGCSENWDRFCDIVSDDSMRDFL